jgi:hypothetical protein
MPRKKRKTLHGTAEKVIKPVRPGEPEKAQIAIVEEGEALYREIRIKNELTDGEGKKAA